MKKSAYGWCVAGAGCDSTEVKVVWGRTQTELTKTTLLDAAAPHSTELTSVLKGLSPNTTYYAKLVAKNANGFSSESEVKSFATGPLREDEFGSGRPVWIASTNETDGAVTSFDLGFSTDGSFGEADLYVLYGSVVGGNTTDSWEHGSRARGFACEGLARARQGGEVDRRHRDHEARLHGHCEGRPRNML